MVNIMSSNFMNVINLGNSIIGVSILAMPYCFQKCGILLSVLLIILSGILVRIACYLLLKGAIMARRRNFEFLAFHALGSSGKLAVEIGIIGFLIGVCIAFFVVIGDLGPPLVSQYMMTKNTPNLRIVVLVLLGVFVALPLGLLRKVDSLTSLSAISIAFYIWLVLKIFSEASTQLLTNEWWYSVNWWQPGGLLPCLPIFSMALSCQTQLFEFFDTLSEPSLKRMMSVVSGAVYMCSSVYILVGLFGYIACHDKVITGNILVSMTPSIMIEFIKVGFICTLAISFPLCLFPCRTSLHSLLFKQGLGHHDLAANFIPDHRFRLLTISLVMVTIGIAIMIPNIEFVLGIIGSTIGTTICLIFPAVIFIHDTNKNTAEKRLAQIVMFIGLFILLACTYSTLKEGTEVQREVENVPVPREPMIIDFPSLTKAVSESSVFKGDIQVKDIKKKEIVIDSKIPAKKPEIQEVVNEKRQEPPLPRESDAKVEKVNQNTDLDPQALQKEDKEIQKEILHNPASVNVADISLKEKQEQLLRKLEEQHKEQKIIIEQQKKVLEELKLHKESHGGVPKEKVNPEQQKDRTMPIAPDQVVGIEIVQTPVAKPAQKPVVDARGSVRDGADDSAKKLVLPVIPNAKPSSINLTKIALPNREPVIAPVVLPKKNIDLAPYPEILNTGDKSVALENSNKTVVISKKHVVPEIKVAPPTDIPVNQDVFESSKKKDLVEARKVLPVAADVRVEPVRGVEVAASRNNVNLPVVPSRNNQTVDAQQGVLNEGEKHEMR